MPRSPRKVTAENAAAAMDAAVAAGDAALAAQPETAPPAGSSDGTGGPAYLQDLPLDLIDESPDNPRTLLPDLPGLAASIRAHGVIEPIVVRPVDGRFRIIAGHRRAAAAAIAGRHVIPAIVRADVDDVTEHIDRMIENLQRLDLNPVEEARGYATLKRLGMKQQAIADAVGRNPGHVSKRLILLELPASLQARVGRREDDGGITLEQAVDIGRLPGRVQVAIAEGSHADDDKRFRNGWDFDQLVRREARVAEQAGEVTAVVKELRAAKLPVLNVTGDEISPPPSMNFADGPFPVRSLDVDAAEHAKLPCHALVLLNAPHGGGDDLLGRWTQPVCTDPASHVDDTPAAGRQEGAHRVTRETPAADPEVTAKRDALAAAAAARTAWAADLIHGKVAGAMRDYVLRGQIRDAILGREYYLAGDDAEQLVAASECSDVVELLALGVTGAADRLVRAALAARLDADLAAVTEALRAATLTVTALWPPSVVDTVAFFEFARKVGYEPAEIEVAALEAIAEQMPDPVRAALIEADLITEPDDEPAGSPDAWVAAGVSEPARTRAVIDGVPYDTWLEPGRDVPTGRCTVCHGPAKALTVGNAGRHAPGGGSVRKGTAACPGTDLHTITSWTEHVAAVDAPAPDPVTCSTCDGLGRVGSADDDLASLPPCSDCHGAGMVAPAAELATAAS